MIRKKNIPMEKRDDNDSTPKANFWNSTLGVITKVTGLLGAITGLILAIRPLIHNGSDIKPIIPTVINYDSIAADLGTKWIDAVINLQANYLVSISGTPFYFDDKLYFSKEDIRKEYEKMFAEKNPAPKQAQSDTMAMMRDLGAVQQSPPRREEEEDPLKVFKVKTIAQLKNEGHDFTHDRFSHSFDLHDDDYIVEISSRSNGVELLFRRVGTTLLLFGFWG